MNPLDTDLLVPPNHFGFLASPFLVVLLGLLVPGLGFVLCVGRALSARTWQRRVDRAMSGESPALAAGPTVLIGEVLTDDADAPQPGVAIKVALAQQSDGTIAREVGRTTHARPFYLRTDAGEVVRVEPGASPTLAAPLEDEGPGPRSALLRYRAAFLRQGERAICAGRLARGFNPRALGTYRAAEGGWVLGAGRGNMWVSGEGLASLFERKARFFFLFSATFAALFVVAQLVFAPFYRLSMGETTHCTVSGVANVGDYRVSRPRLLGTCDDGTALSELARMPLVDVVESSHDVRVTRMTAGSTTALGPLPTVSWLRVGGLVILMLTSLGLMTTFAGRTSRSWYERRRVIESLHPLM